MYLTKIIIYLLVYVKFRLIDCLEFNDIYVFIIITDQCQNLRDLWEIELYTEHHR